METFTIEIKKEYALRILEDLQAMDAISFFKLKKRTINEPRFKAISIATKGFKFNREEANER